MRIAKIFALSSLFLLATTAESRPAPSESGDLTLAAAAPKPEFIIDGADWQCVDIICHADWVDDMPALRSCQRIVVETGAVTAFTWRGRALSTDELAQCNTRAKA